VPPRGRIPGPRPGPTLHIGAKILRIGRPRPVETPGARGGALLDRADSPEPDRFSPYSGAGAWGMAPFPPEGAWVAPHPTGQVLQNRVGFLHIPAPAPGNGALFPPASTRVAPHPTRSVLHKSVGILDILRRRPEAWRLLLGSPVTWATWSLKVLQTLPGHWRTGHANQP